MGDFRLDELDSMSVTTPKENEYKNYIPSKIKISEFKKTVKEESREIFVQERNTGALVCYIKYAKHPESKGRLEAKVKEQYGV